MKKAQIRKLGERLRAPEPARDDLDALAALQDDYLAALERVDQDLREQLKLTSGQLHDGVALAVSNRLKRDRRIIEKLRRGTELDRMQDIVGFRIVGKFSLSQQDDLTNELAGYFSATVKDRRSVPSFGYRAVHLVAVVDGFIVEVQNRTFLQDIWAQGMESISDAWGREIQYGAEPEPFDPTVDRKRSAAVTAFKDLSPRLAALEEHNDDRRRIEVESVLLEESKRARDRDRLKTLGGRLQETIAAVDEAQAQTDEAIEQYNTLLAEATEAAIAVLTRAANGDPAQTPDQGQ